MKRISRNIIKWKYYFDDVPGSEEIREWIDYLIIFSVSS